MNVAVTSCLWQHGFHLGHMRLQAGKRHHYEFDARVPFLVRGPGILPGSEPRSLVGNVDIAPTFLALAGWRSAAGETMPPQMDGRSFATELIGDAAALPQSWSRTQSVRSMTEYARKQQLERPRRAEYLLEFTGMTGWPKGEGPDGACIAGGCHRLNDCPNNTYRGLRVVTPDNRSYGSYIDSSLPGLGKNILFTEFTSAEDWHYHSPNFHSYYDLDADPYQLTNLVDKLSPRTMAKLVARLQELWKCSGVECA
eukprot:COSAG02_NODE_8691_length_2478_cov_2.289617_3_plen_254_part_00